MAKQFGISFHSYGLAILLRLLTNCYWREYKTEETFTDRLVYFNYQVCGVFVFRRVWERTHELVTDCQEEFTILSLSGGENEWIGTLRVEKIQLNAFNTLIPYIE